MLQKNHNYQITQTNMNHTIIVNIHCIKKFMIYATISTVIDYIRDK